MVSFKIRCGDDIRRISIDKETPFKDVVAQLKKLLHVGEDEDIILKYLDDEGDKITLSSDLEFKEALYCCNEPIQLYVVKCPKGFDLTQSTLDNLDVNASRLLIPGLFVHQAQTVDLNAKKNLEATMAKEETQKIEDARQQMEEERKKREEERMEQEKERLKKEEAERKRIEEERLKREEDARNQREDEERKRKQKEDERLRLERIMEELKRIEDSKKKAEEEKKRQEELRQVEEERKRVEEERMRIEQERIEEERKRALQKIEEEGMRIEQERIEEERKRVEEERMRIEQERIEAEKRALQQKIEEERKRIQLEKEEQKRIQLQKAEEEKRKAEEEKRKAEEEKRKAEEEKRRVEEEARKKEEERIRQRQKSANPSNNIDVVYAEYKARNGKYVLLDLSQQALDKFGVRCYQRVNTPVGPGTVIGVDQEHGFLWFQLDKDKDGISYWDDITDHDSLICKGIVVTEENATTKNFIPLPKSSEELLASVVNADEKQVLLKVIQESLLDQKQKEIQEYYRSLGKSL